MPGSCAVAVPSAGELPSMSLVITARQAAIFCFMSAASLVVVEVLKLEDHGREPRGGADLPRSAVLVDVQDLGGGDGTGGAEDRAGAQERRAGMLREEPVGGAPADGVKLDALDDPAPARRRDAVLQAVQDVGLEDLELERDRQAVLGAAPTATDEHLARFDDGPHDLLLEAREVEAAVGVAGGRVRPGGPARGGLIARRRGRARLIGLGDDPQPTAWSTIVESADSA